MIDAGEKWLSSLNSDELVWSGAFADSFWLALMEGKSALSISGLS